MTAEAAVVKLMAALGRARTAPTCDETFARDWAGR